MASIAATVTPPLLTAEANTSAVDPPPQESEVYSPITNHSSNTPPPSQELQTLPLTVPSPPSFLNSILELKDLSDSISAFKQCYDDLHNHLDSIKAAILSKLPPETQDISPLLPSSAPCRKKPDVTEEKLSPKQVQEQTIPKSELEGLCKTMCSRGVRRYLVTHLSDLPKIREEVPKALKIAPNPSKLVLECMGKFFLQGSKAFTRDSPMIPSREASILMLECFLLMMGINGTDGKDNGVLEIEKSVREEAEHAALAWQKRLVVEGGLARAKQVDARGLLLFVACFGIPTSFKREDIRDLVLGANTKEIVGVLKNSQVLMNKIPEIVEGFMKNRMEVDAAEIAYTFELEERFNPQTILTSFLKESKESGKKPKKASQGSTALNEANKRQLAALRSVKKFFERHNIDPAKFLPGWQISEKISTLQKDIADTEKKAAEKAAQKRKANEAETSTRSRTQEAKRSRYNTGHSPQQHNAIDSRRNFSDIRLSNSHATNYSAPQTVVYGGPGAGLLPESMISTSHGGAFSTGSYAGVYGGVLVDSAGQVINRGAQPYVYHGDTALIEKYAGQPKPSVGLTSLYRAPSTVEGFAGVLNTSSVGVGSRSSASSDLYQFADTVVEKESYSSSVVHHSAGAAPTAVPAAHHPSYLYQM
ncbi:hypothetical protein ACJIZ3_004357 [Penstemon smallii]|uniref:FRIGIDA-like protein n=1 Tax=Penstemon smallii TaxID=265156 RepID=A0ABD3S1Z6_9LAMI